MFFGVDGELLGTSYISISPTAFATHPIFGPRYRLLRVPNYKILQLKHDSAASCCAMELALLIADTNNITANTAQA